MAELYYIDIEEEISAEGYQTLLGICASDKREAINKYRYEADRKRTLYGEALARFMIAKQAGVRMKDIEFGRNPYGKPYVKDQNEVFYNISHSGKYVVCGLDIEDIGVDIEEIREIDLDIAKRFFHVKEYADIVSREISEQIPRLYDFWTLKESYIKYLGVGLSKPLDSFYFILNGQSIHLCSKEDHAVYFHRYLIQDNYRLAACISRPDPINMEKISLHDLAAYIDGES
ncbi:4'-phosphopantetheinyl transferase superfamily protein [Paenibacillus sp. FSL K6-1217]|uniref:4'-phosphopantetheinyl transferase family protein n=1 Tax=Paenibacillus sp. FSL K6-1217 TaxID=2921466 RepID=UPI003243FFAA